MQFMPLLFLWLVLTYKSGNPG